MRAGVSRVAAVNIHLCGWILLGLWCSMRLEGTKLTLHYILHFGTGMNWGSVYLTILGLQPPLSKHRRVNRLMLFISGCCKCIRCRMMVLLGRPRPQVEGSPPSQNSPAEISLGEGRKLWENMGKRHWPPASPQWQVMLH